MSHPFCTNPLRYGIDTHAALTHSDVMHSVQETPIFTRRADALLTRDERAELISALARDPQAGDLIPGLGGIRKMRFGVGDKGKRGGVRVIWFVVSDDLPVLALLIYAKNEQANPTPDQRKAMLAVVESIKRSTRRKTA